MALNTHINMCIVVYCGQRSLARKIKYKLINNTLDFFFILHQINERKLE